MAASHPPKNFSDPKGNFELTFGPLLIGVILNVMLLGVFFVQVYSYFRLYKTDHSWIRYLVLYLIFVEVVNTVCNIGVVYEPLITLRDSPVALVKAPTMLAADPIITVLISTPTQLFMAWRIRLVTKSNWFSGLVALLALVSFVAGIIATISVPLVRFFSRFADLQGALATWLTSTAFADLFITAFLVNFLWSSKTGFSTQADNVTDKIIFLTIQTGAVTSFAAIADVTLFLIAPYASLRAISMFIWDFSLAKLYAISLVSVLNARAEWNVLLDDLSIVQKNPNGIIKIRSATDIQDLQLYIPGNFEFNRQPSPRKRTNLDWDASSASSGVKSEFYYK
ncbi:hypothetical protein C8J57DRAFT_1562304 [Mycena rebaudengoi]|nr:hypothetical protein C8J57DRAFT_1562304 [Mycena rebaudengoi]